MLTTSKNPVSDSKSYAEVLNCIPENFFALLSGRCNRAGDTERLALCIAAKVVADMVPLPEMEVTHPDSYFKGMVIVGNIVSAFNERCAFDVVGCKDLAYRLWSVRYHACHLNTKQTLNPDFDFFCTWLGVPNYISTDDFTFLTCNKHTINLFANQVEQALL